MEKKKPIKNKSRKKKSINVKVDTKNVDVEFDRDENGDVEFNIDTKKIDANYRKVGDEYTLEVDIDNDGIYDFVANGNAKFMEKGQVWKVTGKVNLVNENKNGSFNNIGFHKQVGIITRDVLNK
jgi:hypothetical protein